MERQVLEQAIEKLVRRCFTELSGGYHLPRLARVVGVGEALDKPQVCDTFRPYYAVDLELLTPDLVPDKSAPIYKQVPLPFSNGGTEEQGLFAFPNEGTIVEIAFAFGMPHRPFIRTILPHLTGITELKPNEQAWQQSQAVRQRANSNGDWLRETFAAIIDQSTDRQIKASTNNETYASETKQVTGNSDETIEGFKRIVALGALRLLTGGTLNLSAGDNLSLTSATDLQAFVGRNLKQSVGNDHQIKIKNDSTEEVGNIKQSIAQLKQQIKVADGGTVWVGSNSVNVLKILTDLIQVVSDIANASAGHKHAYVDTNGSPTAITDPSNEDFSAPISTANGLKDSLDPIVE